MTQINASPGIYFETVDYSTYAATLSKTILALVGKTAKGPSTPTYISLVRQYLDIFGVPRTGDFSALAAVSYLEQGNALWFNRLVGSNAVKSSVEIPKAYQIEGEEIANSGDGKAYIYSATLNNEPIPGTVKITVEDPNDSTKKYFILDDGNGNFSPVTNFNISEYPNFIDYDTGTFRFTLDSVVPTDEVSIRYNYREVSVVNSLIHTVEEVNVVDYKYSGILSHPNILPDNFSITVNEKEFTIVGEPSNNVYALSDGGSLAGTLNVITGEWELTFTELDNLELEDEIRATYSYTLYKVKTLGVIGTAGVTEAFIDSLNTVVVPESVSVLVNGEVVATDNGKGSFIGDIKACANSINYATKAIKFALVTPLEASFTMSVSYTAKYNHVVFTAAEETVGGTKSSMITFAPVVKNSVTVTVGSDILTDDGEGVITGNGANGNIDYDTGAISINFTQTLNDGDSITVTYLQKIGEAKALSYGSYYDGITLEFYYDQYNGYGLKVWNSQQYTSSSPEENWKDLEFVDRLSNKYFMSKVAGSGLIELELFNETSNAIPVLNTKLILSGGNDDSENISVYDAVDALEEFSSVETYDINLIACPDFPGDKVIANKLIQLCEVERGDCFALIDPPQNLSVQNVVNWHNGDGQWANENSLNSSFAALYYPWVNISNNFSESNEWVPPSVKMVSVYAFSDSRTDVWFAPAGLNRGKLFNVLKTERVLNVNDRDLLYATGTNAVNPICNFVGDGVVVYGQKTLQRKSSALDRVNVMRLMLYITKILATSTKYLLFEPHDQLTWILYRQLVNPVFESIKAQRGLYEFSIVCDETTNTPYYIDNNTLVAEVWLKPTKTTERIVNKFIITSTGANFSELSSAV